MSALLKTFQDAVLSGEHAAILPAIKPHPRLSATQQFAIYSEGYRLRLLAAIRSDYPALIALIGNETFDVAAQQYIEATPSKSYTLDIYPHGFAGFFAKHSNDMFAAELALLEQAIAEVFTAPDSDVLAPDALAGVSMDVFAGMKLPLRDASKLLQFEYPVNDWLVAQRAGQNPAKSDATQTWLLVYRHHNEVKRLSMSHMEYLMLEKLDAGLDVGEALDSVAAGNPINAGDMKTNLQNWFANWMQSGVFKGGQ